MQHGSTLNTTLNLDGTVYSDLCYTPFGKERWAINTSPTGARFTAQRLDDLLTLYNYNARYYDPAIGRFISADTLVPDFTNLQAWNRYSYVLNSPLNYIDPTGHAHSEYNEGDQDTTEENWQSNFVDYMLQQTDRLFLAAIALYEDYMNRFGEILDVPEGSTLEFEIWQMAYQDVLAMDRAMKEGNWLTNYIREVFGNGHLDPLDVVEGSLGVILATTAGNDSNDESIGPITSSSHMSDDQIALKDLVNESTLGQRKSLTVDEANTVNQWAVEVEYPGFRASPDDLADKNNHWVGGPHIHLPGTRKSHIPVQSGVTPVTP